MKKILTILLAALLAAGCFAGCTYQGPKPPEEIDKDRTQLYVGVFEGALGYEWLTEYKKAYETENPQVQVIIDNKKDDYQDGSLIGKIANSRQDVYFLSGNNYSTFVDLGLLEDITTTVTEKVYDDEMNLVGEGGTQSIVDAMYDDFEDLYCVDEKYYGLPNFISPAGIVYDADLFEDPNNNYQIPTTYNELIALMDRMVIDQYTPFAFSNLDYITLSVLSNVWASYEGKANYELNNSFSGYDTGLKQGINKDNAYLLQQQEGRKAALKFAKDVMSKNSYTTSKTRSGQTHRNAQDEFIRSIYSTSAESKRVAMFLESSYWETEAKSTFQALGRIEEEWGFGKRNFKFMPFPKFVGTEGIKDQVNQKQTVFCSNTASMVCINKASDQKELAKDFLQFVHSRKNLAIYTQYTSCVRPFEFEMTADELAACTPFGRSIYEVVNDPDIELTYDLSISPIKQKNGEEFVNNFKFGTDLGRSPFTIFYNNQDLSVADYFAKMQEYWSAEDWASLYAPQG